MLILLASGGRLHRSTFSAMISSLLLSLIFFEIYEIIGPTLVKKLLRLGILDPYLYLFGGSVCFICCCCYQVIYIFLCVITRGVDPETELERKFPDGFSQMVHVGFGVAGALAGILVKEFPQRILYEWLLSTYPIYFYAIGLSSLSLMRSQLAIGTGYPYWLGVMVLVLVWFCYIVPYLVVIICGNAEEKEENEDDQQWKFFCLYFSNSNGHWDIVVELPKSQSNKRDRLLFHLKVEFVEEESGDLYLVGDRQCGSNCLHSPVKIVFHLIELPDWLLAMFESSLEKRAKNPAIVLRPLDDLRFIDQNDSDQEQGDVFLC